MTLSVSILSYNEESNIERCLKSVKGIADEIIVVDEKSTDRTAQIAKKYTNKIYFVDHGSNTGRTHDTMFHKHKQLSLEKCTGEWILQIDCDEELSVDLAKKIKEIIASKNHDVVAFRVPRRNLVFGRWFEATGFYPDYQIKLIKKGHGKYPCKSLHEDIEITGPIGTLDADIRHYHYSTVEKYLDRLNRYTTDDARYIQEKGETVVWSDVVKYPSDEFIKRFFLWEGYKDGLHGLIVSLLQAFSRLVVFAKIWEQQKYWEYKGDIYSSLIMAKKAADFDFNYWVAEKSPSPWKRFMVKAIRKIWR